MKIKLISSALISIILIGFLAMIYMKESSNKKGELCVGTSIFKVEDSNNPLTYTIHYRVLFSNNGNGYIDIRGTVINDGSEYVIARNIIFTHLTNNNKNDSYEMKITEITKTWQDNTPDYLIDKYLPYMTINKKSYLKIDEINEGRSLLSANQGPFLICSNAS